MWDWIDRALLRMNRVTMRTTEGFARIFLNHHQPIADEPPPPRGRLGPGITYRPRRNGLGQFIRGAYICDTCDEEVARTHTPGGPFCFPAPERFEARLQEMYDRIGAVAGIQANQLRPRPFDVTAFVLDARYGINRDFVDATAFGDPNATYLVRDAEVEADIVFRDGVQPYLERLAAGHPLVLTLEPGTQAEITTVETTFGPDGQIHYRLTGRVVRTAEEVAAERERVLRAERERYEAEQRAKELLYRFLSDEQIRLLESRQPIRVVGSQGGEYDIWPNGNVATRFAHPTIHRPTALCVGADYSISASIPVADQILAKVLMIQNHEDKFLYIANPIGNF